MDFDLGIGLGALALVIGFPVALLLFVIFLGRLEVWILAPDERAAAVSQLLEQVDETEELEKAVALMMADVTHKKRGGRDRRRALRIARRRRLARSSHDATDAVGAGEAASRR